MKLNTFLSFSVLISASLILPGCATVMSGTTQNISVQAINKQDNQLIPGTVCTIADGKGRVYAVNSNPGTVMVTKGQGKLDVQCHKPGYHQTQVGIGQNFNAWTVADVMFWPGALVDAATGAIQKYPSHITVLMQPTK